MTEPPAPAEPPVPAEPSLPSESPAPAEPDVELLAAALRADTSDLDAYHHVLSSSIGDLLPPGMVEVDRQRTMADRMAGRPGTATAIRLHLGDKTLELVAHHGRLVATIAQTVRGVTISRKEVPVAEWVQALAAYLAAMASDSAEARAALGRLLGG